MRAFSIVLIPWTDSHQISLEVQQVYWIVQFLPFVLATPNMSRIDMFGGRDWGAGERGIGYLSLGMTTNHYIGTYRCCTGINFWTHLIGPTIKGAFFFPYLGGTGIRHIFKTYQLGLVLGPRLIFALCISVWTWFWGRYRPGTSQVSYQTTTSIRLVLLQFIPDWFLLLYQYSYQYYTPRLHPIYWYKTGTYFGWWLSFQQKVHIFYRYPFCWKLDLDTPCKRAGDANILQTDHILSKCFNNFFVMVQSNWLLAYLSMKQGSLVCFVCHIKISQTTALHVTILVSSESPPE